MSATKGLQKPRLKVAFSTGATSAMMARLIQLNWSHIYDIIYIMANTSREDDRSLEFGRQCDQAWGLGLVIVEAVVHPDERKGSSHRVVTFDTACRDGSVFEDVIKKYGIPNMDFEPCNRELKLNAMNSYMRSIGWADYQTAVGIRMDESIRVNPVEAAKARIIYPLIDVWPRDKQDVRDFWEDQPFRLEIEEYEGNCKVCWKKSDKKLFRLAAEHPEHFDWTREMEQKYGWHGAPHYGAPTPDGMARVFFRRHRNTDAVLAEAKALGYVPGIPVKEVRSHAARQYHLDLDVGGCGESCHPFQMVPK